MVYLNSDGELVEIPAEFLRTEFNYDRDAASRLCGLDCPEETKTQQNFREECDINVIVKRFGLTGEMPQNWRMPSSQDFSEAVTDFHTAANMILAAEDRFMELPAEMRAKFDNDPQRLLDFLEDAANIDAAREMGLVPPLPAPPDAIPVILTNPSTPEV